MFRRLGLGRVPYVRTGVTSGPVLPFLAAWRRFPYWIIAELEVLRFEAARFVPSPWFGPVSVRLNRCYFSSRRVSFRFSPRAGRLRLVLFWPGFCVFPRAGRHRHSRTLHSTALQRTALHCNAQHCTARRIVRTGMFCVSWSVIERDVVSRYGC